MKRILILMVAVMALGALAADVEFPLVDLTSGPTTNRRVLIQPVELQGAANKLPLMDVAPRTSDAEGRCWVSNMVAGLYSVTVQGPPSTTRYQILVPETNGVLNARALLVGSTNVPGVGVAYTAAASDARYPLRSEVNTGEGISLAQATSAAKAVVETNTTAVVETLQGEIATVDAARQAEIYSASNAAYTAARSLGSMTSLGTVSTGQVARLEGDGAKPLILRAPIRGIDPWGMNLPVGAKSSATNIIAQIDHLYTNGLVAHGWRWVQISDGWQGGRTNGHLYPNGIYIPDITNLCAYAAERGVKLILYTEPFAGTSAGKVGSAGYTEQDVADFVAWGIRAVRLDMPSLSASQRLYQLRRWRTAIDAVTEPNDPVILYSSGWQKFFADSQQGANVAACFDSADVIDVSLDNGMMGATVWDDYLARFRRNITAAYLPREGKCVVPQVNGHPVNETYATFWGLYSLIPTGLMPASVPVGFAPGMNVMRNTDLLEIYDDPGRLPATQVWSNETSQAWCRMLANGDRVLGLVNLTASSATIPITLTNAGIYGGYWSVYDVLGRVAWATNIATTVPTYITLGTATGKTLRISPAKSTTVSVAMTPVDQAVMFTMTNLSAGSSLRFGSTLSAGYAGLQFARTNFGWNNNALWGGDNQTSVGVPPGGAVYLRSGGTIIMSASASGIAGSGSGITNIPLTGVTGLPGALAWLTNNIGGGGTGAVSSVNGLTGAVTLDAADVGAQPADPELTNWAQISTNIIGDLRQEIADTTLDFVPQYGTPGLTNLAGFSTNNPAFSGVIFVETNEYGAGIQTPGGEPFTFHTPPIFPSSAIFSAMPQMQAGIWMGDDNSGINLLHETGNLSVGGGLVVNGEISATGGIDATNLTGTIDAARLPPATTNTIWGGINLSNPAVNAIYMLSITTNTTLGNFGNMHASEFRTAQLWITNGGASSQPLTLPAGTSCPDGNPLYVTNGQRRVVSVGGIINFTNAISRALP